MSTGIAFTGFNSTNPVDTTYVVGYSTPTAGGETRILLGDIRNQLVKSIQVAGISISGDVILVPTGGLTITTQGQQIIISGAQSGSNSGGTSSIASITNYIGFSVDGAGSILTTGLKYYEIVPFSGTIVNWSMSALPSGSVAVDIYKISSGNNPPIQSIVNNVFPSIVNGLFQDVTGLGSWSTIVTGGDRVGWVIKSAATVTKMNFKMGIKIS